MLALAAQQYEGGGEGIVAAMGAMGTLFFLALTLVVLASLWKVFTKAGEPGWAAIVPIYNVFVLAKIAGKEMWWGILLLIPCVGIVVSFILSIALAEKFGKGAGFGVGLALLPFIFYPILGFGSAEYETGMRRG